MNYVLVILGNVLVIVSTFLLFINIVSIDNAAVGIYCCAEQLMDFMKRIFSFRTLENHWTSMARNKIMFYLVHFAGWDHANATCPHKLLRKENSVSFNLWWYDIKGEIRNSSETDTFFRQHQQNCKTVKLFSGPLHLTVSIRNFSCVGRTFLLINSYHYRQDVCF